jgi:hypothetical protein
MIVLRRANGDIIWFDAVTNYDTTYSSSVTKHPIASGGYISDHTTTDNVVLQINAVLSDADFNIQRSLVEVKSVTGQQVTKEKQFTNNTSVVYPVQISDTSSKINKLLPEVIAQFTKDTIPTAYVTPQDKAKTALAVKLDMISMWKGREEFQVLDIVDNTVVESFNPCVFTHLTFREDETTGDGVFPNMTIEQVVYTDLQEVRVKVSNKGRKNGTSVKKATEDPPANNPTQETKKDAGAGKTTVNNMTGS